MNKKSFLSSQAVVKKKYKISGLGSVENDYSTSTFLLRLFILERSKDVMNKNEQVDKILNMVEGNTREGLNE